MRCWLHAWGQCLPHSSRSAQRGPVQQSGAAPLGRSKNADLPLLPSPGAGHRPCIDAGRLPPLGGACLRDVQHRPVGEPAWRCRAGGCTAAVLRHQAALGQVTGVPGPAASQDQLIAPLACLLAPVPLPAPVTLELLMQGHQHVSESWVSFWAWKEGCPPGCAASAVAAGARQGLLNNCPISQIPCWQPRSHVNRTCDLSKAVCLLAEQFPRQPCLHSIPRCNTKCDGGR